MSKNSKEKSSLNIDADLFLIDSSSYFYRAYYALPPLTNSKGMSTGASLGYTRMLMKLIRQAGIKYGACLFDSHKSLRKESYAEYKANRKGMPEELLSQVDYLTAISHFLGFSTFRLEGYEADDLIAYIIRNVSEKESVKTCIVSSDKDLKQLLSQNVLIFDALKSRLITAGAFENEYDIKPQQFLCVLALMGDASDNIPGVKGVGEKTALDLIRRFKTIDGIYEGINEIKQPKLKELLLNHKEDAYKSLGLASFFKDVDINGAYFTPDMLKAEKPLSYHFKHLEDFALSERNEEGLYRVFKELEFNSLLKEINQDPPPAGIPAVHDDVLSIYIDLAGKKPGEEEDLLNFSDTRDFPIIHMYSKRTGLIVQNMREILENKGALNLLRDKDVKKAGLSLAGIKRVFEEAGVEFNGMDFDLAIASYLINPIRHRHGFSDIEEEFSGEINLKIKEMKSESALPPDNSDIAFKVFLLYEVLKREIEKDKNLNFLFFNVDVPLSEVLADMERIGFLIDKGRLMSLSAELDFEAKKLTNIIHEIAGRAFNVNSPKQLAGVMFEEMKFKRVKKESTDIDVLSTLKSEFEALLKTTDDKEIKKYLLFLESLISYRNKVKLKTSFTDILLREADNKGRVHTSFSQVTTSTGRLASQNPNLQNIPVSGVDGLKIRQSFISKEGSLLLSADYSQIDLRIIASISGDKALIKSFLENEDIHSRTASEIFGVGIEDVDPSMRRKAKVINFGIIYGMSPYGLSKELGISAEEGKTYIDRFFQNHPYIKEYMDKAMKEARAFGYVRTAFGRKCFIPYFAERAAINAPIQGTAADIIKIAMVNIHRAIKSDSSMDAGAKMILQVHDELIFEVKEELIPPLKDIVRTHMTDKALLKDVPLIINIGTGKNWADAH